MLLTDDNAQPNVVFVVAATLSNASSVNTPMNQDARSITAANDETTSDLIHSASSRLIILAPALTKKVAQAVSDKWRQLGPGAVNVILDLDPEVFRLGYGDFEALKVLEITASELGTMIQRQRGIRIGLIVADDTTMVYSPIPALIEAGPSSPSTPCPGHLNAAEKKSGGGHAGVQRAAYAREDVARGHRAGNRGSCDCR